MMLDRVVRLPVSEASSDSGTFLIGHVVESNKLHILIDYPGNSLGPIPARSAVAIPKCHGKKETKSTQVILVFENGDLALPFIIGIINGGQQLPDRTKVIEKQGSSEKSLVIDAESLVLSGRKEVILQCGKGSITLREDGKIVIKGVELVSRASHSNKIKGITVNIN